MTQDTGMTLAEYLKKSGRTATSLAKQVGCATSTITRAAKGQTLPTRTLMTKIYLATGQLVHPRTYLELAK